MSFLLLVVSWTSATALIVAGESAPWVIVGHSLGAPYAMVFTNSYDAEVAGLVFVDGTHPDQFARFRRDITRVAPAFLPVSVAALLKEVEAISATLATAKDMRTLRDRPLVVLTSTRGPSAADLRAMGLTAEQGERVASASRALHEEQATWSRCGRHEMVPGASHYIQFDRPDVVVHAVRDVVDASRAAVCSLVPR